MNHPPYHVNGYPEYGLHHFKKPYTLLFQKSAASYRDVPTLNSAVVRTITVGLSV